MMSETRAGDNRILASLPAGESARLAPHLEPVEMVKLGEVLFHPGEAIAHVYFPTTAIVSLLTELSDGAGIEVGLVGFEGMVGVASILGGETTKLATVQGTGAALRLRATVLREEFARGGALFGLLLRYTHALMTQISQSVVCNARHHIPVRLARWLLMYSDRARSDEFYLTQEFMASMLGVRRAGISEAAEELQRRDLIRYRRGQIAIVDRARFEEYACECYGVVKALFPGLGA